MQYFPIKWDNAWVTSQRVIKNHGDNDFKLTHIGKALQREGNIDVS